MRLGLLSKSVISNEKSAEKYLLRRARLKCCFAVSLQEFNRARTKGFYKRNLFRKGFTGFLGYFFGLWMKPKSFNSVFSGSTTINLTQIHKNTKTQRL